VPDGVPERWAERWRDPVGEVPVREVSDVEHGGGARTAAARSPAPRPAPAGFRHGAAVVDGEDELLSVAVPFLEEGLRAGDVVAVSCPEETVASLRAELGPRGGQLVSDPALTLRGARAPDALARARGYLARSAEVPSALRVLSAVDDSGDPQGRREEQRWESACNRLLQASAVSAMCVYDRSRLPRELVDSAAATHPRLVLDTGWTANPRFEDPLRYVPALARLHDPLEDLPPVFTADDAPALAGLRHDLGAALAHCVADREQREDLHLAISEVAANAFRHGVRPVSARLWCAGGHLICCIADSGPGFDDPLAGFQPAHGEDLSLGGMGLWLARKLWDSVDLLPGPAGFAVRLSTRVH
jgi:anti-sigma regulatory factor (Ser/Thr protein kinase)